MNCIRNICTLILIPWLSLFLTAQEYLFDAKLYTKEDGLANMMTRAIHKDQKGFLWIATSYGLSRFDGVNFELFTEEIHGLKSNNHIQYIREDDQGLLWLIYAENKEVTGIDIFDPITLKRTLFETVFEKNLPFRIKDLIINKSKDKSKRLWFSTKSGQIFSYQKGQFTKQIKQLEHPASLIQVENDGNIWLASSNQLLRYSPTGKIDTVLTVPLPNTIYEFGLAENNELWVTTEIANRALEKYSIWLANQNGENLKPFTIKKNGQNLTHFNKLTRNSKGFWFITTKELRLQAFNAKGRLMYDIHDLLPKGMSTEFFQHYEIGEQNWFATPLGLIKTEIKQNPFQLIYRRKDLADCRNIIETKDSTIYFLDVKIHQWKPKEKTLKSFTDLPGSVGLIYTDSIFWTGSYGGKNIGTQLDLKTGEQITHTSPISNITYHTLPTQRRGRYLAGQQKGLGFIDLQEKIYTPFDQYNDFEQLKAASVYFLHKNKEGIWLATSLGIFLLEAGKGITKHFHKDNGDLPFNHIKHIFEDKKGDFWLATKGGGIIQWQHKNGKVQGYKQLTTKDGLSNNYTYAIYGDDYGKLWIPSDKGLMCLDKKTLDVRTYLMEDGLPHNEFNSTSHFKTTDGSLYFGGLGGIIRFHPKDFANSRTLDVPLQFIAYSVLEEDAEFVTDKSQLIQNATQITIKPSDKFARLDFSLLDYDDPTQHSYAYRIEGYSEQWNYIKENYVPINSLPYGNYQLKIKGRNISKGWTNQDLSLDLVVEKPFYLQTWFIILMAIGIAAALFAIIKHRLHRLERDRERLETEVKKRTKTIREQAEQLKELDEAKTRFFSNITHEFRTPLTLIIGPLEQIMEEKPTNNRLNSVLRNAKHLLGLINQMLDLSKLEGGQMKVELKQGDIVNYTQALIQQIKPLADKKQQQIQFSSSKKGWRTQFDNKKWNKIIYNLLSNAIKFTPEHGQIVIDLAIAEKNNQIQLLVKDTGVGIEANKLPNIFNRFYQTDDSSTRYQEGTGIGLALVKELVELQNGSIAVESELGVGTTFKILLPILAQIEAEIIESEPALPPIKATIPTAIVNTPTSKGETPIANEKLTLLIIEDNEEMRSYIKSCIATKHYIIEEAKNGIEGIEIAQTLIPDLIISDVMMPGKDGFEVTDYIRNNKATSHIPIILLTAKAALESRLEGIQKGADVYLTKPFSPKELRLRIEKLIEIRQLIQQNVNEPSLNPVDPIYEKENLFIQEIRWVITNNIDNKNLNGEFIGQQLGMSRMQVHRKMKALINQSASDMIKDMRLQKAHELLLTRNYNSSEVAYQTGFNTLAYFSKVFKEKFGYSPSEINKMVNSN